MHAANGTWTPLETASARAIIRKTSPLLKPATFPEEETTVEKIPLSFYAGDTALYALTTLATVPPVTKYALVQEGSRKVYVPDWTPSPILAANRNFGLLLTRENVSAYLRFFLRYVNGAEGSLSLVESPKDMSFVPAADPLLTEKVKTCISPLSLKEETGEAFLLHGSLLFENDLCAATFHVRKADGHIDIQNEETRVEELPLTEEAVLL